MLLVATRVIPPEPPPKLITTVLRRRQNYDRPAKISSWHTDFLGGRSSFGACSLLRLPGVQEHNQIATLLAQRLEMNK
jgi:hypothetical protein